MVTNNTSYLKALARLEKSVNGFGFYDLPPSLLNAEIIDLSKWTLIVSDYTIQQLTLQNQWHKQKRRKHINRVSCKTSVLHKYCANDKNLELKELSLDGAEKITDLSMKYISGCTNLNTISLKNVYQLSGSGLKTLCGSCTCLREVNLNGCRGISGESFSEIGKNLKQLCVLKVSGCNIATRSFVQIFEGCKLLEVLNVACCASFGDQELKVLSSHCHALTAIVLKHCPQVSDLGILSLSQGCTNIQSIDLKRSKLLFKITDVALSALNEQCTNLSSICLHGCEIITDVGISWLCQGSTKLQCIHLAHCTKITNIGIAAIAKGCPLLKKIRLDRLKRVTDVGLSYLAQGCEFLEDLHAAGLFRLSNGTQGNAYGEGLRALGKSKCAQRLKRVNLHGCFQISTLGLNSIANFVNIQHLTVSGCPNLTYRGLYILSQSCHHILSISFASCGDCINDLVVEVVAKGMEKLTHIDLSRCGKIGKKSLSYLSLCKSLKILNLAGCKGVNDRAILALSEASFYPGIQSLLLRSCKITDVGLQWISEGFKGYDTNLSLLTLSLEETMVTLCGLQTFRDCFYLSELKNKESSFGFYPVSRAEDRKMINAYSRKYRAATRLQAKFRNLKAQKRAFQLKQGFCRKKVAVCVQSIWRGNKGRFYVKEIKRKKQIELESLIIIQSFTRRLVSKIVFKKLKCERWMLSALIAACKIQARHRGNQGRQQYELKRKEREHIHNAMRVSSTKIQCCFRRCKARRFLHNLRHDLINMNYKRFKSARRVQLIWRVVYAKELRYKLQNEVIELQSKQNTASKTICQCYRKHFFRKILLCKIEYKKKKISCTLTIQCFWRVSVSVRAFMKLEREFKNSIENAAAIIIQNEIRRILARIVFIEKRILVEKIVVIKNNKAKIISHWWRLCAAKCRANELRRLMRENIIENMKLECRASSKIAAVWRGKKGRDIAQEKILEKKARWKHMWSEEDERYFYYNQITGESRWRRPQDLLDLDPRPICSNCEFYEAQLECANCSEYFCFQCWDAVHFGGKRASHEFRSLYDYYGKRLDYGDKEFPSRWPTEIEQDENQGKHKKYMHEIEPIGLIK